MAYEIVLETFSGPLDLLLHLIQKQEVNIHDIPIALITDQYMAYLHAMEELSLDVASEFVVMAATLLAIKSRMLLPRQPVQTGEAEEVDPRAQLVEQLLEYQKCKHAVTELRKLELLQSHVYARDPMDLKPFVSVELEPITGVTLWDLVDAFRKIQLRIPKENMVAEIKGIVFSVDDMMETLRERLQKWSTCTFLELIHDVRTRPELVTSFLALLELVKLRIAICEQISPFGDIQIRFREDDGDAQSVDSTA